MDDLAQWLTAQLDEEQGAAEDALKRATTTRRRISGQWIEDTIQPPEWRRSAWPPARVLREIDAKRRILARHTPHVSGSPDCTMRCERSHPGAQVCNHDGHRWPCPDVRDLADCYAHRPDYLEPWRP